MDRRRLAFRIVLVTAVILAVLSGWGLVQNAGPRAAVKAAVEAADEAADGAADEAAGGVAADNR